MPRYLLSLNSPGNTGGSFIVVVVVRVACIPPASGEQDEIEVAISYPQTSPANKDACSRLHASGRNCGRTYLLGGGGGLLPGGGGGGGGGT